MTIRIRRTGAVVVNAHWFGFNFWARAWVGDHRTGGWMHWPSSEFEVVNDTRM